MKSRIRTHNKTTREQIPDTMAQAEPMFQSRPFVVQSQSAQKLQPPDLKTSVMRAERYGHHLSQMHSKGVYNQTGVQPKRELGRLPMQHQRAGVSLVQAKLTVEEPQGKIVQRQDGVVQCRRKRNKRKNKNKTPGSHTVNKTLVTDQILNSTERAKKPENFKAHNKEEFDLKGGHPTDVNKKGKGKGKPKTLTAHHKFGLKGSPSIEKDAKKVVETGEGETKLANWADPLHKQSEVDAQQITWANHNIFMGPLTNDRGDDPDKRANESYSDLDTHFTASGTVTPKSDLALHIHKAGGITNFDSSELNKRLKALPNPSHASEFKPDEWQHNNAGKWEQKGMPKDWPQKTIDERIDYAEDKRYEPFRDFWNLNKEEGQT
ncbi:hypothetical protein [Nostoc sp.]|uniref:hypothetical protein n=1 Tax=Nostoc sp. TaxID=1180 RepID=UPI002FF9B0D0